MLRRLRQLSSANNLAAQARRARASGPSTPLRAGQIATFLLLMIMAVLVFAMMTANLGHVVKASTGAANAADQAALLLGSQLATKSLQLHESIGSPGGPPYQKCKKGGLLKLVLAVVVAILLIVLTIFVPPVGAAFAAVGLTGKAAIIAAGTIGGAAGGAMGGAIAGTGAAQGAFQGAMIGAAIGMGVASFGTGAATVGQGGTISSGTTFTASGVAGSGNAGVVFTSGTSLATGASASAATNLTVLYGSALVPTFSAAGAVVGGSLAVGSSTYNAVIQDAASMAALDDALNSLNKFPERARIEQGALFDVLQSQVDDPELVPDVKDFDGDGNTTETVLRFIKLWDDRVNGDDLRKKLKQLTDRTQRFVDGPLTEFRRAAGAASSRGGWLSRRQIEGSSGILEQVVERLEDPATRDRSDNPTVYPISFWETGPSREAGEAWADCDDPNVAAPTGFDETDALIADLQDIVELVDALKAQQMESLMAGWRSWTSWFYDAELHEPPPPEPPTPAAQAPIIEKVGRAGFTLAPKSDPSKSVWIAGTTKPARSGAATLSGDFVDYYTILDWQINGSPTEGIAGMSAWREEIQNKKQQLPACTYRRFGFSGGRQEVRNSPCRGVRNGRPFWTVDRNFADEFASLERELADSGSGLIPAIRQFRADVKAFSAEMKQAEKELFEQPATTSQGLTGFIGSNPVFYRWQDVRGDHMIEVEVGPFRIPWLRKRKTGNFLKNKTCIILTDYEDRTGQRTWVRLAQHRPANKAIGVWTWNPVRAAGP